MANIMKDVARALGVELEEEFMLDDCKLAYKLSTDGLVYWSNALQIWEHSCAIEDLLTGNIEIIKLHKPILTDKEKEYLSNVIKPFRKHIITIRKIQNYKYEFIEIVIYSNVEGVSCEVISFPYFNRGEMYKGIKINKEYTLKELGL